MVVAGLGDTALVPARAAGVLARRQPGIAHESLRPVEAADVSEFHHDTQRVSRDTPRSTCKDLIIGACEERSANRASSASRRLIRSSVSVSPLNASVIATGWAGSTGRMVSSHWRFRLDQARMPSGGLTSLSEQELGQAMPDTREVLSRVLPGPRQIP